MILGIFLWLGRVGLTKVLRAGGRPQAHTRSWVGCRPKEMLNTSLGESNAARSAA